MRLSLLNAAVLVGALSAFGTASAAPPVLSSGIYHLNNHPDGGAQPPGYGLRLDGLDGNPSRIYSFDFNDSRSNMLMDLDLGAGTIRIYGESYGGRDVGSTYGNESGGRVGLWEIDFTYTANVSVRPNGTIVAAPSGSQNSGYIQPLFNSSVARFAGNPQIPLIDFNMQQNTPSFLLELGHRGFAGVSGYGWLNHSGEPHVAASDWLFTVGNPIPSPSAAFLGLIGLAGSAWVRRRLS